MLKSASIPCLCPCLLVKFPIPAALVQALEWPSTGLVTGMLTAVEAVGCLIGAATLTWNLQKFEDDCPNPNHNLSRSYLSLGNRPLTDRGLRQTLLTFTNSLTASKCNSSTSTSSTRWQRKIRWAFTGEIMDQRRMLDVDYNAQVYLQSIYTWG